AALNYLLLAFAPSLGWLVLGRIIAGITGASFSAATAYIADITPAERRAQAFGLVGAAFGVGFILGPALGGLLGGVHLRAPFMAAAGLNLINVIYGLFVLPESLRPELRRPFSLRRANSLASLKSLTRSPMLFGLTGTIVCSFTAQMILQCVWALHTQARFDWQPFDIGISLAVVGVASALVQGGLVRVVTPRLGETRTVLVGLFFSVAGYIAMGSATRGWMMYVLIFPFALGGLAGPATQAILTREATRSPSPSRGDSSLGCDACRWWRKGPYSANAHESPGPALLSMDGRLPGP
ncbi:MAG: MFS transporter, partial [Polyangiaceae bacterium]